MQDKFSKLRHDAIDELDKQWLEQIAVIQRNLAQKYQRFFATKLDTVNGRLRFTTNNLTSVNKLPLLWVNWLREDFDDYAGWFLRSLVKVYRLNSDYFSSIAPNQWVRSADDWLKAILDIVGLSESDSETGVSFSQNSVLQSTLYNTDPARVLSEIVTGDTMTGVDIGDHIIRVENTITGGGERVGLLRETQDYLNNDPFVKFDRISGQIASSELQLNYAIYQGGKIATSREFCILRDNICFHRSEIARFGSAADPYGGYTNHALGEFQGKCPVLGYNPFVNLGGCNCRHSLDWIGDELGELLKSQQDNQQQP